MPRLLVSEILLAWRRLLQTPTFTIVAIVTLGLGIGANTAVFSVLEPLVLRRLPVANPGELVLLGSAGSLDGVDISERVAFDEYAARRDIFAGVLADAGLAVFDSSLDGRSSKIRGAVVSATYFSVLGVRPFLGRLLVPEDDFAGPSVVVLGFDYWSKTLSADPTVVGQPLTIEGKPFVIVGVAPRGFSGMSIESVPDFYAPLGSKILQAEWIKVVGRLRSGIAVESARASLDRTFHRVMEQSALPEVERQQYMARLVVTQAGRGFSDLRPRFETPAWLLMGVVALVLIVACANVVNLFLARSASRRTEVAVMLALGAPPARIVRQLVWESVLVAVMGTLAGVVAAYWVSGALAGALASAQPSAALSINLNARVLAVTAVVLCLAVLVCGLLPAWTSVRTNIVRGLRSRNAVLGREGRASFLSQVLVVAQVGVSVTLLAGAGLLLHSLHNLHTFNVGFDRDRVLTISLADGTATESSGATDDLLSRLTQRVRALPGVRAASISTVVPVSGREVGINVMLEGGSAPAKTHAFFTSVTTDYFVTLGIPLVAGRDFSASDDPVSHPVAILNQSMARHYFGDETPLGRRVRFIEGNRPAMEIIGVAADAVYKDVREQTPNFLYLLLPRHRASAQGVLFVRTDRESGLALAAPVLNVIAETRGAIRAAGVRPLRQYIDDSLRGDRVIGGVTSGFSALALAIAAIGLYGVLSLSVARRTREIGIRIALGARRDHIARLVAGEAASLTLAGLAMGAAGAYVARSLLETMLFGVRPADPVALAGVLVALCTVAALACYFPARRAMGVDPTTALRANPD